MLDSNIPNAELQPAKVDQHRTRILGKRVHIPFPIHKDSSGINEKSLMLLQTMKPCLVQLERVKSSTVITESEPYLYTEDTTNGSTVSVTDDLSAAVDTHREATDSDSSLDDDIELISGYATPTDEQKDVKNGRLSWEVSESCFILSKVIRMTQYVTSYHTGPRR